jgi:hypothetical protein
MRMEDFKEKGRVISADFDWGSMTVTCQATEKHFFMFYCPGDNQNLSFEEKICKEDFNFLVDMFFGSSHPHPDTNHNHSRLFLRSSNATQAIDPAGTRTLEDQRLLPKKY